MAIEGILKRVISHIGRNNQSAKTDDSWIIEWKLYLAITEVLKSIPGK